VGFLRQPAWTAAPIATVLSQPPAEARLVINGFHDCFGALGSDAGFAAAQKSGSLS
jgi:hypothetical protein